MRLSPPLLAVLLLLSPVGGALAAGVAPKLRPLPPRQPELALHELNARPADYQPSGAPYDWTKTQKPERDWFHKYDQSVVMKLQLSRRNADGECEVLMNFDQALKVIERLDGITCEVNKIIYLVGWQGNGTAARAPDWNLVNPQLKGANDKDALAGLRHLMVEARKHNTTVSLQLNMSDASEDSPLWAEYLAKDVVAKDKDGKPIKDHMTDGVQFYRLSYAKEWETGLAKKRIDELMKAIPELYNCRQSAINGRFYGHTVMLDGFRTFSPPPAAESTEGKDAYKSVFDDGDSTKGPKGVEGISPLLGYTYEQEAAAQRKTFRYFRDWQVDVVCDESTIGRLDPFVGLQPFAWHFKKPYKNDKTKPEVVPSLYYGTKMRLIDEMKKEERDWDGLRDQFAFKAAPALYENWYRERYGKRPTAQEWAKMYNGEKGDCFIPMPWWKGHNDDQHPMLIYSKKGYEAKPWELPKGWELTKFVNIVRITASGKQLALERLQVAKGTLFIEIRPREMYIVLPEW